MMQPCASAAKLRSGGPILFLGITAMAQTGTRHLESSSASRHKRTDWAETVGCLQQPAFIASGAERRRPAPRPLARAATRRSKACAPRPRSWACAYRARSRCGLETTAPRRCSSETGEIARPIGSCLVELERCRNGPALGLHQCIVRTGNRRTRCSREKPDAPDLAGLLRAGGKRPSSRTAERDYQFPPSDGDWHVPLSVSGLLIERNDTTPRVSGLHVRERRGLPVLRRTTTVRSGSKPEITASQH